MGGSGSFLGDDGDAGPFLGDHDEVGHLAEDVGMQDPQFEEAAELPGDRSGPDPTAAAPPPD